MEEHSTAASRLALFVYYQVPAEHAAALAAPLDAILASLRREHAGLQARRWVRAENTSSGGPAAQTWMESYEHPEGLAKPLAAEIEARMRALPAAWMGQRHVETFALV